MKKLKISFEERPKTEKRIYKSYPRIDSNVCAFGDEEDIEVANVDYIRKIKAKVLRRYLLPTVIIAVILIGGCVASSLYFLSEQNTQIAQLHTDKYNLEKRIDYSNEYIDTLNRRIENLNTNNNNNSTDTGDARTEDWREFARKLLEEHGYYDNSKNTSTTNTSNENNSPRLCTVPDCNRAAKTGSEYCYNHECAEMSCHEKIANDRCRYCEYHKCTVPDCNNERQDGSYYCSSHECIYPGCHKKRAGISYCAEHQK